ncbi:MAG: hypothetical protein II997_06365 [Clostridia bacterium]|nr:hypothetical protein [Clostridia bacterium]
MKKCLFACLGIIMLLFFFSCNPKDAQMESVITESIELQESDISFVKNEINLEQECNSFIANKKSKKLHYPNCVSVRQMKENNKIYLTCSREDAFLKGYTPCQRCNP